MQVRLKRHRHTLLAQFLVGKPYRRRHARKRAACLCHILHILHIAHLIRVGTYQFCRIERDDMFRTFHPLRLVLILKRHTFIAQSRFGDLHVQRVASPHHIRTDNHPFIFRSFGRRRIMGSVAINTFKHISVACIPLVRVEIFHSPELYGFRIVIVAKHFIPSHLYISLRPSFP